MNTKYPAQGTVKDQYQHAIPRFILRTFENNPVKFRNARERSSTTFFARLEGKTVDTIHYYDLNTGVLSNPSIAKVYGKTNLYRDSSNVQNVDHLEEKLSGIENAAAAAIKVIHRNISNGNFTISRLELYTLRKFIFLMHYRHDAMSTKYFQEDIPNNARLTKWIRKYKEVHRLSSVADIWRHGLKYYLDTPHQTIVTTGENIRARYGADRFHEMLRSGVDPDLEEEWFAVDYESQANGYVLGVWEAAKGSEFVLGGNGFGLWEGSINGTLGAHKIYVMSPQIAIVLRHHILLREGADSPEILTSCLSGIEIRQPKVDYFLATQVAAKQASNEWTMAARVEYRRSPQAQKDTFTFPITKLTDSETYAVNEVVMMNANMHQDGAITYGSHSTMLNTLQRYMTAQNTFVGLKKGLYRPLLQELLKLDLTATVSDLSQPLSPEVFDFGQTETDMQLSLLLRMMISGGMEFTSTYNRAYLVYHMATNAASLTNPITLNIRKMVNEAVAKLTPHADVDSLRTPPPSPTSKSHLHVSRTQPSKKTTMALVETLSKEESTIFFERFRAEVEILKVGKYTNDLLNNITYEAGMIGIAHWLAETRPAVLSNFFKPLLRAPEIL